MKQLIKISTVIFIAAGIILTSWLRSGEIKKADANYNPVIMRNFWPAPMPSYPTANEYPLSSRMKAGSSPMKMSWFRTTDEPLQITNFYSRYWKNLGHYVTEDVTPIGGKVSALDLKSNLLRQVVVSRKDGESTVFVSMIMGKLAKLSRVTQKSVSIPVYPGAEGLMSFDSKDAIGDSTVINYVDRGTMADNVAFYNQQMAQKGYTVSSTQKQFKHIPGKMKGNMKILIFQKDDEEITVTLSPVPSSSRIRVHVTRMIGKGQ
ncbi:MAG: hypothetical protein JXR95_10010 [Deltaproteobacteria bacterium]|nr:hypothetical protein [Deltaproteobacteria bacterium]